MNIAELATSIILANRAAKAAEKENKAERELTREERVVELIKEAVRIQNQNAYDEKRANRLAPLAAARRQSSLMPSAESVALNKFAGTKAAESGDTKMESLVAKNFQQFQDQMGFAQQQAKGVTPDSLYTKQQDPLTAYKEEVPAEWLAASGQNYYTNKRGDGLDEAEVGMLNKALAQKWDPKEISKMLATFKREDVQQGVVPGQEGA
jgi:hypothetical protein